MRETKQVATRETTAISWEISGPLEDIQGSRRKVGGQETVIRFCTYNIWNGRNVGLKLELRGRLKPA